MDFFHGIEVGARDVTIRPSLSCLMEIFLDVQLILFISKCKVTSPISLVTFTLNCTCISRWKQIQDDLQIQMAPSAWV